MQGMSLLFTAWRLGEQVTCTLTTPQTTPPPGTKVRSLVMETCNIAPTVRAPFSTQSGAVKEAVLGAESDSPLLLPLPQVIQ